MCTQTIAVSEIFFIRATTAMKNIKDVLRHLHRHWYYAGQIERAVNGWVAAVRTDKFRVLKDLCAVRGWRRGFYMMSVINV